MKKRAALSPEILKALGVLGAGAGGAALGQYVMPRIGGYEDIPAAKNWATLLNAAEAAGLAASHGKLKAIYNSADPALLKLQLGIPAAVGASEFVPQGIASLADWRKGTEEQTKNTIPAAISRLAGSGMGRGATAGAALAGLGAMTTGLTRARTEEELKNRKSRARMIANDFAKYLLPLAIAGGVTGTVAEKLNTKRAALQRLPRHI